MKIRLTTATQMTAAGLALSLGWVLFEGCTKDKEEKHPETWVACINNQPMLVAYSGDDVATQSNPGNFDPKQWDCKTPQSPGVENSMESPYPIARFVGSSGQARAAGSGSQAGYLLPQLRDLPFIPPFSSPKNPPPCDSSFTDVLQTVHTNALVTRISTCPFQIKATIPVATRPLQIAITPDGATALVTSFDNAVNFIDLGTNRVTFTLMTDPTINPNGIAISPDGTRAYVSNFNTTNASVLVIDIASRKVIATVPTIAYPSGLALTPDGSQLWVASPLASSIDIIDTLTNTSVTGLGIGAATGTAFNSTGTRAYITSATNSPGDVVVVETATYKTLKSYKVGAGPTNIKMSYGDEFLVVNNVNGNSISVVDLLKDSVITKTVGSTPTGIAFVH